MGFAGLPQAATTTNQFARAQLTHAVYLCDRSRVTLERATFDLPAGTFHALVGGDRAAPPLVFLHGFPDQPPTATPFLEQLARTHRVIAPWLRGYAPSPRIGPYDLETL